MFTWEDMWVRREKNAKLEQELADVEKQLKKENLMSDKCTTLQGRELALNANGYSSLWRRYFWSRVNKNVEPMIPVVSRLALSTAQPSIFHCSWKGPQRMQALSLRLMNLGSKAYRQLKRVVESASNMKNFDAYLSCQGYIDTYNKFVCLFVLFRNLIVSRCFRIAPYLRECLEESIYGKRVAFAATTVSYLSRLMIQVSLTPAEKFWGMFAGHLNWLAFNRMDRMTGGGKKSGDDIDGSLRYRPTKETVQLNVMDLNLHVCVCFVTVALMCLVCVLYVFRRFRILSSTRSLVDQSQNGTTNQWTSLER